jgi:hypothetical protein
VLGRRVAQISYTRQNPDSSYAGKNFGGGMGQLSRRQRLDSHHKSKWRLVGFVIGGILGASVMVALVLLLIALHVPPPPEVQINALSSQRLDEEFRQAAVAAAQSGTPFEVRG